MWVNHSRLFSSRSLTARLISVTASFPQIRSNQIRGDGTRGTKSRRYGSFRQGPELPSAAAFIASLACSVVHTVLARKRKLVSAAA
jgi:hypothetical protein